MKIFKKNKKAQKVGINFQKEVVFAKYTVGELISEILVDEVLTIGSASHCDLVLEHESVSKVHCKIFNNNAILSIIDCSSAQGTFVNKKPISPNKQYILQIEDTISVGQFLLSFEKKTISEQRDKENSEEIEENNNKHEEVKAFDLKEEMQPLQAKKMDFKSKKIKRSSSSSDALNAFFRVMAICIEVLIVILVLNILNFYFDMEQTLSLIVSDINQSLDRLLNVSHILDSELSTIPALKKAYEDLVSFSPFSFKQISTYFYVFFILRIIGNIIWGMSAGQFLIGAKTDPQGIKARLLGILRCILDFVLFPIFFITKFSTLFSKPSLEETLSRSLIQKRSFLLSSFLSVFFILFFSISYLSLPLLYYPDSMITKFVTIDEKSSVIKENKYQTNIHYLNLSLFSGEKTVILPRLSIKKNGKNIKIYPQLAIISEKSQIKLKRLKEIDSRDLFRPLYSDIVFLKFLFPEISSSFDHFETNSFKMKQLRTKIFAKETYKALKASYSINFEQGLNFLRENGPFLSPYIDFQRKVSSFVEIPFDEIKVFSRQSAVFIFFQKKIRDKIYLNLLIIDEKLATLYDLSLENISLDSLLEKLDILKETNSQDGLTLFFSSLSSNDTNLKTLAYHEVYELFFDSAKKNINNDFVKKEILKSAKNIFDFFKNSVEHNSQAQMKLVQNLGDFIKALENNDESFFNIKSNIVM